MKYNMVLRGFSDKKIKAMIFFTNLSQHENNFYIDLLLSAVFIILQLPYYHILYWINVKYIKQMRAMLKDTIYN